MHLFTAYLQSLLVAAICLNVVCGIQTTGTNGQVEKLTRRIEILESRTTALLLFSTCTAMKRKYPKLPSGFYDIYPEGIQRASLNVYCDMTSKDGSGVTVIGHDSEQRTIVNGYQSPGSYKKKIVYKGNMSDIAALTKISKHCEQFIKYECIHSRMSFGRFYTPNAWWVSRQGAKMIYWGGAAVNSRKCACGMTKSCGGGGHSYASCNCDVLTFVLGKMREDSGYLSDKTTLPVTELRFGSTGYSWSKGYHTLGKLKCWG